MDNKLVLRLLTATEGKYFTVTIDDIKTDFDGNPSVTEAEVNSLMDVIIARNIFVSPYGDLTGKKEAKIVITETNGFTVA